jgi:hypothetical protein
MSQLKEEIFKISNQILEQLLIYRETHLNFTFSIRERDSVQSEEKRLESGQWFQGANYIYVPFFSRGDSARKIKTLGFVITFEENGSIEDNYVEISFKGGVDDENEVSFHNELAEKLNVKLTASNHGSWHYDNPEDYLNNLKDYLHRVYPLAVSLLEKYNLKSEYLIPESRFNKNLQRINQIKQRLTNSNINSTAMNTSAKNIILYGPPGTGKTYNTVLEAVKIITGNTFSNHKLYKEEFDKLKKEGQIEFVTFHQNYSYEDFVLGVKPNLKNDQQLTFSLVPGIFYRICKEATDNYLQSLQHTQGLRSFSEVFEEFKNPLLLGEVNEIQLSTAAGTTPFWLTAANEYNFSFRKNSGGEGHTLSYETIRDLYNGTRNYEGGLIIYYQGVLNALNELGRINLPVARKNYVLIIDEINRANISKVFGELITLLEEDKRLGAENELRITIPNTDKELALPPNLFIIGTMNTADKSIALIDIALRRRFEFQGFYPTSNLLDKLKSENKLTENAVKLLQHLNTKIYKEKNSADYLIGHAYLIDKSDTEISSIIAFKFIPLLMEYFSGRAGKVEELFKDSDYSVTFNADNFGWDINTNS